LGRGQGVLGVAAVGGQQGDDSAAYCHRRYSLPNLFDRARYFPAQDGMQRRLLQIYVAALHGIGKVDPGRFHPDEHLAGTRLRGRHFFQAKHFRPAKLAKNNVFHERKGKLNVQFGVDEREKLVTHQSGSRQLSDEPVDIAFQQKAEWVAGVARHEPKFELLPVLSRGDLAARNGVFDQLAAKSR
jgi:hypothetical protein